ncbi:hypothetical protein [Flavisphingomonas formosensis]|uniref:hypothetical protein n=1 Tax=Flavisphingomonas formosensis TaxID=861534 RepID=UPI0012FB6E3A|nr:hypothetical protein [Sphingomonas formosensis]
MNRPLPDTLITLAMITVAALVWGGVWTIRKRPSDRVRGLLMLVAALVLLGNVAIVAWPT